MKEIFIPVLSVVLCLLFLRWQFGSKRFLRFLPDFFALVGSLYVALATKPTEFGSIGGQKVIVISNEQLMLLGIGFILFGFFLATIRAGLSAE